MSHKLDSTIKQSNPKDAIGVLKAPTSTIPMTMILALGVAMLEGSVKYSRHNYREVGVRASVYFDALQRHMMAWWEGEDVDPDSMLSHIIKGIATLTVLYDAIVQDKWVDDRPPKGAQGKIGDHLKYLADVVAVINQKYPNAKMPYTELDVYNLKEKLK